MMTSVDTDCNDKSPSEEPKIMHLTPWKRLKHGFLRAPEKRREIDLERQEAARKLTRKQLLHERDVYSTILYNTNLENRFLKSKTSYVITHQQREITKLQADNESILRENKYKDEEIEDLQADKESIIRDNEYKDVEIEDLRQKTIHWRGEHSFLVRELLQSKMEKQRLEKEKAEMLKELERLRVTCIQQVDEFMDQLNESYDRKKDLHQEMEVIPDEEARRLKAKVRLPWQTKSRRR